MVVIRGITDAITVIITEAHTSECAMDSSVETTDVASTETMEETIMAIVEATTMGTPAITTGTVEVTMVITETMEELSTTGISAGSRAIMMATPTVQGATSEAEQVAPLVQPATPLPHQQAILVVSAEATATTVAQAQGTMVQGLVAHETSTEEPSEHRPVPQALVLATTRMDLPLVQPHQVLVLASEAHLLQKVAAVRSAVPAHQEVHAWVALPAAEVRLEALVQAVHQAAAIHSVAHAVDTRRAEAIAADTLEAEDKA